MTQIVAGLFSDQVAAQRALSSLRDSGIAANELNTFVVNPPGMHGRLPLGGDEGADPQAQGGEGGAMRGATLGGAAGIAVGLLAVPLVGPVGIAAGIGAGAFVGSLAGAVNSMGDEATTEPTARPGGVMVAVNVERGSTDEVIAHLRDAGATLIERDDGEWSDGKWSDFDPVRAPGKVVWTTGNPNYPT